MKTFLVAFFLLMSFVVKAGEQCSLMAEQELATAKIITDFYVENFEQLKKFERDQLTDLSYMLLDSASENNVKSIFVTTCSTRMQELEQIIPLILDRELLVNEALYEIEQLQNLGREVIKTSCL